MKIYDVWRDVWNIWWIYMIHHIWIYMIHHISEIYDESYTSYISDIRRGTCLWRLAGDYYLCRPSKQRLQCDCEGGGSKFLSETCATICCCEQAIMLLVMCVCVCVCVCVCTCLCACVFVCVYVCVCVLMFCDLLLWENSYILRHVCVHVCVCVCVCMCACVCLCMCVCVCVCVW